MEELMSKVKIGVIGSGYWGPNLIRNFVELPDAEVVVVADLSDDRLGYVRSRYPRIKTTRNYRDFFKLPLDAVVVATPPATHYPIALECLQHGLHVLVEKPLTLDSWHAGKLIEVATAQDLMLMVGHTFEYNPAVRALKEMIESGELGDVYYIDMVRVNLGLFQADLNVLWDLAPHDISMLLYLLGENPISVNASGSASIFNGKHDTAHVHLLFPDEVQAHVHVSWLHPSKVRRVTVVGSKKMVVYDDVETLEKIKIYDKGVNAPPYTDSYGEFQCSYRYGNVVIPNIAFAEPLRLECQHFLDSIRNHTEPQSDGWAGWRVVKVLEVADRSLQNGSYPEKVPADKEQAHAIYAD
jgi:predicted dehydrogenase